MSSQLKELEESLRSADPEDEQLFHLLIVLSVQVLGWTVDDLAHFFDISRPSVRRWLAGRTAPHPAMRIRVYEKLINRCQVEASCPTEGTPQ